VPDVQLMMESAQLIHTKALLNVGDKRSFYYGNSISAIFRHRLNRQLNEY